MPGPPGVAPPSCDRCRTRKVKCVPLDPDELEASQLRPGERCKGCYRADKDCTHNYVHKKPGRPLGSRKRSSVSDEPPTVNSVKKSSNQVHGHGNSAWNSKSTSNNNNSSSSGNNLPLNNGRPPGAEVPIGFGVAPPQASGSGSGSMFVPPRNPVYQPYHPFELEYTPDSASNGLERVYEQARTSTSIATFGAMASTAAELFPSFLNQHPPNPFDMTSPGISESWEQKLSLDDLVDWSDVCWFVSLFLKEHHCLVPLVHKPSFSQDVLNRRDRHDEAFRGLLCSMVAYVICQSPVSIMLEWYERPKLVSLLHKCTRAAEIIRQRQRTPSLVLLASTVLDWIAAQAVGKPQLCDSLIEETTRLSQALGLTSHKPRAGTDAVQLELCRRLYWIVYSKDKVDALSGRPIILPDFEAPGPLPLEIDDDYITPAGHMPQPAGKTSYMAGFVFVMRVWMIVSRCVALHRALSNEDGESKTAHLTWISLAQNQLRDLLQDLPCSLRSEYGHESDEPVAQPALFGIQQTNITITVLCAEFALLDFRASLSPSQDTRLEREELACRAYKTIENLPIEYVASNGESMRGKVLRIILTLLSMATEPENFSQNVWDWWNMYSRVQYLQLVPDETMLLLNQTPAT